MLAYRFQPSKDENHRIERNEKFTTLSTKKLFKDFTHRFMFQIGKMPRPYPSISRDVGCEA